MIPDAEARRTAQADTEKKQRNDGKESFPASRKHQTEDPS